MRYLKNKKAQGGFELGYKWPFYIIVGFFLAGLMFFLWWQISQYTSIAVAAPTDLYSTNYIQRFINSPNCFAYKDEIGRVYPGILDWNKFSNESLRRCFFTEKGDWKTGFQLILQNGGESMIIETDNYYQYRERKPSEIVLIRKDDQLFKGNLSIGIQ